MEDKLEEIFSLQKGLTEMMNLDRYPCNVLQTGSGGKNLWSSIKRKLGKSWQTFGIF